VFRSVFCLQVIKTLDPKQQPATASPDIEAMKNQLTEKERKIQHLEVKTLHTEMHTIPLLLQISLIHTDVSFFSHSMTMKRAESDTTRRRSSSFLHGTIW